METEYVDFEKVEDEVKKQAQASGGKWVDVMKEVLRTGKAALVTGITKGQVAAASKACKNSRVKCRTFYKSGKVILYKATD